MNMVVGNYRTGVPYYAKEQNKQMNGSFSVSGGTSAAESGITLQWSDGAIYAEGTPDGQNFSVYKAKEYSKEHPLLTIKGKDMEGNAYEQQVNPFEINPYNASYAEIMALNAYFVDIGSLESTDMPHMERFAAGNLAKADYLNALRDWREVQVSLGNMAGFHKAAKVCEVFVNFWDEQTGNITLMDAPEETVRAYKSEDYMLQCPGIGLTVLRGPDGLGYSLVHASYAENSTAENPVVRVQISDENGRGEREYDIYINDIDPRNATQMEMFALCSHLEKQGIVGGEYLGEGYSNLIRYASDGGYDANAEEFVNEKKDWVAILSDAKAEELTEKYPVYTGWRELFLELLEQYLENLQQRIAEEEKEKAEEKNPAEDADGTVKSDETGKGKTDSRIIEKADGSKVLEITKESAGMEFKMYMEVAKGKDA